jgi:ferredoxin
MADRVLKLPENVPGKFYVDSTCIDCELCRELAPRNFERNDADGRSYVATQPINADEEKACVEALYECPVEAIGNEDGISS